MPKSPAVPFHRDFRAPTKAERDGAIGEFPGAPHASETRREMISVASPAAQPEEDRPSLTKSNTTAEAALSDLDRPTLFSQTPRSETSRPISTPRDDLDWLATVPEEGQTFDEYIRFLTSRSGRIRPIANAGGQNIILLPIVSESGAGTGAGAAAAWPSSGPSLEKLVTYTRAFYDRNVILLPAAVVSSAISSNNRKRKRGKGRPSSEASQFKLRFPRRGGDDGNALSSSVIVKGRANKTRMQLQVTSVLNALSEYRQERNASKEFCVMAVTMEDLYDGSSDLFCAGMAFGGSKVAVFSFFRYHPHLKMHPGIWHDFGYAKKSSSYSYYEDRDQNPTGLTAVPPMGAGLVDDAEFLRRSSKLLTHELAHLYGLDHCIFNRCLMMGSGHLVEDFMAPSHLCPVCLRKLQWRLGYDVAGRYEALSEAFAELGLRKEATWAQKQHARTRANL